MQLPPGDRCAAPGGNQVGYAVRCDVRAGKQNTVQPGFCSPVTSLRQIVAHHAPQQHLGNVLWKLRKKIGRYADATRQNLKKVLASPVTIFRKEVVILAP